MNPLITLYNDSLQDSLGASLPESLQILYGGDFYLDIPEMLVRPYIIANFVTTLDGIVSYNINRQDTGSEISGRSPHDHMVMGILRARADAVLWGSGNYAAAKRFLSSSESIWREGADDYSQYRIDLGLAPAPYGIIVTRSGDIDPDGALLNDPLQPAIVITTSSGAAKLQPLLLGRAGKHILICGENEQLAPSVMVYRLYQEYGIRVLLHEGGPHIFGSFLAVGLIDEVFLTTAPQFAGKSQDNPRPSLVEKTAFFPITAPWAKLVSLKKGGDLLFTRYKVVGPR
jgi:riboflavin biosynthesis pyrimidine reductase